MFRSKFRTFCLQTRQSHATAFFCTLYRTSSDELRQHGRCRPTGLAHSTDTSGCKRGRSGCRRERLSLEGFQPSEHYQVLFLHEEVEFYPGGEGSEHIIPSFGLIEEKDRAEPTIWVRCSLDTPALISEEHIGGVMVGRSESVCLANSHFTGLRIISNHSSSSFTSELSLLVEKDMVIQPYSLTVQRS